MTNEEEVILALKELKDWEGLPYCIEEPMQNEGIAVITKEALDMAIEALEQQPCEDCISRQAVLDNAYAYGYGLEPEGYCVNVEDIQALPSVTPQQTRWIPVSERLPESDEQYHTFLVTDRKGKVTLSEFYLSIKDKKPYWSGMIDVIAWMPLPEPYEAESEDNE